MSDLNGTRLAASDLATVVEFEELSNFLFVFERFPLYLAVFRSWGRKLVVEVPLTRWTDGLLHLRYDMLIGNELAPWCDFARPARVERTSVGGRVVE